MTQRMTQGVMQVRRVSLATFLIFFLTFSLMLLGTGLAIDIDDYDAKRYKVYRTEQGYPYLKRYEGDRHFFIDGTLYFFSALEFGYGTGKSTTNKTQLIKMNRDMKIEKVVPLKVSPFARMMPNPYLNAPSFVLWKDQILVTQDGGIQFFDKDLNKTKFMKLEKLLEGSLLEEYDHRPEVFDEKRSAGISLLGDILIVSAGRGIDYLSCVHVEAYDLKTEKLMWRIHGDICRDVPENSQLIKGMYGFGVFEKYLLTSSSFSVEYSSFDTANKLDPELKKFHGIILRDPKTLQILSTAIDDMTGKYQLYHPHGDPPIRYAKTFHDREWYNRYYKKLFNGNGEIKYEEYKCHTWVSLPYWQVDNRKTNTDSNKGWSISDFMKKDPYKAEFLVKWMDKQYKLGRKYCPSFESYVITGTKIIRLRR